MRYLLLISFFVAGNASAIVSGSQSETPLTGVYEFNSLSVSLSGDTCTIMAGVSAKGAAGTLAGSYKDSPCELMYNRTANISASNDSGVRTPTAIVSMSSTTNAPSSQTYEGTGDETGVGGDSRTPGSIPSVNP
jgi:hypothetical protein